MKNKEKVREVLEQFWTIAREYCSLKSKTLLMDAAIDHALAALESLLGQEQDGTGWVSVEEGLPEEDDIYLVAIRCFEKDGRVRTATARDIIEFNTKPYQRWELPSEDYYMGPYSDAEYRVTHWRPLPALPKTEAGE